MTRIIIHDVDETLKHRLQARAAKHGKSMEAEIRDILHDALGGGAAGPAPANLYAAIRNVVEPLGGIQLEIPTRRLVRDPPLFE